MGLIVAKLKRPLRRFNIDNRARAVISQDKPTRAPHYEAAKKQLKLAQEISPNFLENHNQKNVELDDHLKKVYVTSSEPKEDIFSKPDPSRPLPKSRTFEDFEFGFYIPNKVPLGKCTLQQIFTIISQNKEDSVKYSTDALATQYKLDKETVVKLLTYYKLYHVIMPEKPPEVKMEIELEEIGPSWFIEKVKEAGKK